MKLPPLTVIPAGAGSGKTYSIQQQLGEWVGAGLVAPERIVAVTFTEAAAAELKERISAKLLAMGRSDDALRLDRAYISTIHGFGLRVLTEFAFDAGLSPQPRLLNDDEKNVLIRAALSRTDKADEILSDLDAHGYTYDHGSGRSAETVFRDDLLKVVELLRAMGWRDCRDDYVLQASEWIAERYGPSASDGQQLSAALRQSVQALLDAFPRSLDREHGTSAKAKNEFFRDFQNLNHALKGDTLEKDWKLWQGFRNLRKSMRGTPLPEPYDLLASAVISAANELPRHPGPLQHAISHVKALLSAGQEVLAHYAAAKREAGLVDYSDMIALADQLLCNRPDVLDTLVRRIDCLVVDEFQDTNPLQFSLLWQLKEAGVPTIVVGDLKQAIMGFQGADPRLFEAVARQYPGALRPLKQNWRSQPRLMAFINALGKGLFGDDYVTLQPRGSESPQAPLDVVHFPKKAKKGQHAIRAYAIGEHLKALLEDSGQQVMDRRSGRSRPLRGGDMAVLCPTHDMLATYAEVLRAQGLRVRLQASGWISSRPVQIAWHALAYLANPTDRHAALYLAVTELGSLTLQEGLLQLMDQGRIDDPLLTRLEGLAEGATERTIYALVADMLETLGLFDEVASWPDAEQARANLLRLLTEAGKFMDANREALSMGGFHGAGIEVFLSWLSVKVEEKDGDTQPVPRVLDEHAIELVTWHASKGREWPVVAVCGFDKKVSARLPSLGMGYTSFDDLARLLEHARIEYAPAFAAPETKDRFLADLQEQEETEARRLLYVAMTRARDKLVMEWPAYLNGKTTTYWSLLLGACDLSLDEEKVSIGGQEFSCVIREGRAELPEEIEKVQEPAESELPVTGRRAIVPGVVPANLTPDSRAPSQAGAIDIPLEEREVSVERYGDGLELNTDLSPSELGTLLHRCFELAGAAPNLRESIARVTRTGIGQHDVEEIATVVERFERWLARRFSGASQLREWPVLALDAQNSVVSGVIDLVVETSEGVWVIDHKSDRVDDPVQAFSGYRAQLESYAAALSEGGSTVLGIAINWIALGVVTSRPFAMACET